MAATTRRMRSMVDSPSGPGRAPARPAAPGRREGPGAFLGMPFVTDLLRREGAAMPIGPVLTGLLFIGGGFYCLSAKFDVSPGFGAKCSRCRREGCGP